MGTTRRDDLARRLAERMQQSQPRGRVIGVPAEGGSPTPAASPPTASRPAAGATPSVRRNSPAAGSATRPASRAKPRSRRDAPSPAPATSNPVAAGGPTVRLRRGASGTVLRGHLIPDAVHAAARRRKVEVGADRGNRVTWDEVVGDGIIAMTRDPDRIAALLSEHVAPTTVRPNARRLVQATLPRDVERLLLEAHLSLSEGDGPDTTYEQLWTLAIVMWLRQTTA